MEDLFAGVPQEGAIGDDTTEDSQPEDEPQEDSDVKPEPKSGDSEEDSDEEQGTDEPSEGGDNNPSDDNVPFDKHPRFKSLLKTVKTLKEQNAELAVEKQKRELLEKKMEQFIESQNLTNNTKQIPDEFVELFGNNQKAYELFSKMTTKQMEDIVEARLKEMQESQGAEQKAKQELNQYYESVLSDLADETGLDLTNEDDSDRNEILKVAIDWNPVDGEGRTDLKKAYELWKTLKDKSSNKAKKKVAAMTTDDRTTDTDEEEPAREFGFSKKGMTARDFLK